MNYLLFTLVQAELHLATGGRSQILAHLDELLTFLRQNGIRLYRPDVLHLKGRVLRAAGRDDDAHAALEEARLEAESLGSRRSLWPILAELAELEAGRGDQPAALELRRRAAEIIDTIAAHAGSAELAASFVNQPAVQAVLRPIGRQPTAQSRSSSHLE